MDEMDPVEEAMNDARLDLNIQWQDVASRAGIGYTSLHRFRKGVGPRTEDMAAKIGSVFGWPRGWLAALEAGDPLPPEQDHPHSDTLRELEHLQDALRQMDRELTALRRKYETG